MRSLFLSFFFPAALFFLLFKELFHLLLQEVKGILLLRLVGCAKLGKLIIRRLILRILRILLRRVIAPIRDKECHIRLREFRLVEIVQVGDFCLFFRIKGKKVHRRVIRRVLCRFVNGEDRLLLYDLIAVIDRDDQAPCGEVHILQFLVILEVVRIVAVLSLLAEKVCTDVARDIVCRFCSALIRRFHRQLCVLHRNADLQPVFRIAGQHLHPRAFFFDDRDDPAFRIGDLPDIHALARGNHPRIFERLTQCIVVDLRVLFRLFIRSVFFGKLFFGLACIAPLRILRQFSGKVLAFVPRTVRRDRLLLLRIFCRCFRHLFRVHFWCIRRYFRSARLFLLWCRILIFVFLGHSLTLFRVHLRCGLTLFRVFPGCFRHLLRVTFVHPRLFVSSVRLFLRRRRILFRVFLGQRLPLFQVFFGRGLFLSRNFPGLFRHLRRVFRH